MKLQLSPRASRDINEIGRYIHERNPVAAIAVRNAIRASLNMLANVPYAGRSVGHEKLRRFAIPRLPYLVFYLVDEGADTVRIVTIRHSARREDERLG